MAPINRDDLQRIFKKLDRNGDGVVSHDELKWFLEQTGGTAAHLTSDELETLLGRGPIDLLDFWVFYDAFIERNNRNINHEEAGISDGDVKSEDDDLMDELQLEKDLAKAFGVFDLNGDGFISSDELQITLSRLGLWEEGCGRSCESMIEFYDTNADGLLDFGEFKNMMSIN